MRYSHQTQPRQPGGNKTETSADFNGALVAATTTPSSNGHSAQLPPVAGPDWRQHLHRLEGHGLVVLPIGAGPPDRKFPVDPANGGGLVGWPEHPGFSAAEIAAMNPRHVIGACINTGPSGLDVLDIDGPAAVAWAEDHGVDPRDPTLFRITRTTDPDRFKIPFRLTPEQRLRFPQVKNLLRVGEPDAEGKRQAIETYAKTGAQVIVLGQHCKSGGWYDWAGDPSAITAPSEEWLQVLIALAAEVNSLRGKGDTSRPPGKAGRGGGPWQASSHRHPCPVCGRDHSGACTRMTAANGRLLVSCYHGGAFSPDTTLQKGDVITGKDGNQWALTSTYYADCLGEKSLFIDHLDRPQLQPPPKGPFISQGTTGNGAGARMPVEGQQHERFIHGPGSAVRRGKRQLGYTQRMRCLERCIEVQAQRERNSLRRRARLLKAVHDLALSKYVNRQEIAQRVLEAKDAAQGNSFKPLTAADRAAMPKPVVRWLLPGLVPADDMTIIGGRPKVGKTRLSVAMVGAVLAGKALFGLPEPTAPRPVILVTDDQADGDTADMLSALDLWTHPQLIWSRNFRLTENDTDGLLETVSATPGALVVIDSLRSIGRSLQYGENDPEIGATLYDLKQSVIDAGSTLLLIHHCNKAMDLVGVEALSGHNAIAGAANTVLTMHYLPGTNNQPNKSIPERRLFREGRSGEGLDWVIARNGGSFSKVTGMEQWQADAQVEAKLEKLAPTQQLVKDALDDASGEWLTRRQVCEAIGVEWGDRGRGREARRVGDALARLVELEAAERVQAGTEATYKSTHEGHRTTGTDRPISDTNASQLSEVSPVDPDNPDKEMAPGWLSGLSGLGSDNETPRRDSLAGLSGLSAPPTLTLEFSPPTTIITAPLNPVVLERLPEAVEALGPEADAAALANWLHRQHGLNATAADVMAGLRVRAGQPPSAPP